MRRWKPIGAAVAVLAVAGALVVGVLHGPGTPVAGPAPTVSVSAPPQAGTVAGASLVFATFNVCKVSCDAPAPSWDVRRARVARVITTSGADVIGLQEVTFNPTSNAKTQFLDVQNLIAPAGYVAPTMPAAADQCRWTAANPHPCDNTTGIVFNSRTVSQVTTPNGTASAGTLPSSGVVGGLDSESAVRKISWAYLQGAAGTGPFLVVSVHTDNSQDPAAEASRVVLGQALGPWADAWNAAHGFPGVPTLMLGDLNSYKKRQPNGMQQVMVDNGWLDTASAPQKRNVQYSTINHNPKLPADQQGFPKAPYIFRTSKNNPVLDATRIDYVMARGAGLSAADYEVVIHLLPDGSFDPEYQASDHQMVRSTITFP
jgi:endonuclease/exonuclease/phosphatase family metal-dependent hydrolase